MLTANVSDVMVGMKKYSSPCTFWGVDLGRSVTGIVGLDPAIGIDDLPRIPVL